MHAGIHAQELGKLSRSHQRVSMVSRRLTRSSLCDRCRKAHNPTQAVRSTKATLPFATKVKTVRWSPLSLHPAKASPCRQTASRCDEIRQHRCGGCETEALVTWRGRERESAGHCSKTRSLANCASFKDGAWSGNFRLRMGWGFWDGGNAVSISSAVLWLKQTIRRGSDGEDGRTMTHPSGPS